MNRNSGAAGKNTMAVPTIVCASKEPAGYGVQTRIIWWNSVWRAWEEERYTSEHRWRSSGCIRPAHGRQYLSARKRYNSSKRLLMYLNQTRTDLWRRVN